MAKDETRPWSPTTREPADTRQAQCAAKACGLVYTMLIVSRVSTRAESSARLGKPCYHEVMPAHVKIVQCAACGCQYSYSRGWWPTTAACPDCGKLARRSYLISRKAKATRIS